MELNKCESLKRKRTKGGSSVHEQQTDMKKRQRPNTRKFSSGLMAGVRHFGESLVKDVEGSSMHEKLNSAPTTENVTKTSIMHKGDKDFEILVKGDDISRALAVILKIDICPDTFHINEGTSRKHDVTETSLEPCNPTSFSTNSPATRAHISCMKNKLPVLDLNQDATDSSVVPCIPINLLPSSPVRRTPIKHTRNKLRALDLNQILEGII